MIAGWWKSESAVEYVEWCSVLRGCVCERECKRRANEGRSDWLSGDGRWVVGGGGLIFTGDLGEQGSVRIWVDSSSPSCLNECIMVSG